MDCSELKTLAHPYLDRQIDAAQRTELENHIAQCSPCAKTVESQRAFLTVVKKLVVNCDATSAPAHMHSRILAAIDSSAPVAATASAPAKPLILQQPAKRPLRMRGAMAAAASVMLGFGGLLSAQSLCITQECPIAIAAEHEHERIVAGTHAPYAASDDIHVLTKAIKEHIEGIEGFPSLCHCHLNPLRCGRVKVDGLPEGAYVQYAECDRTSDPVTLMIINTDALSGAQVLNIKNKEYRVAMRSNRVVLSWHSVKSNELYILVAHRPLKESLDIAEVASN